MAEMTRREAFEAALHAWRDVERRQAQAVGDEREALTREVEQHRSDFQKLSTSQMVDSIGRLQAAESRRSHATPSTLPFHEAARETEEIASEIWEVARTNDEDTPQTALNRGSAARPSRPGLVPK